MPEATPSTQSKVSNSPIGIAQPNCCQCLLSENNLIILFAINHATGLLPQPYGLYCTHDILSTCTRTPVSEQYSIPYGLSVSQWLQFSHRFFMWECRESNPINTISKSKIKKYNYINMAPVLFTCSMTKEPLPSTGLSSRICLLSKNVFMTIEVCHYNVFTNLYHKKR